VVRAYSGLIARGTGKTRVFSFRSIGADGVVSAGSSFRCASPGVTRLGKFDWTSCTFGALLCVFPGLSL
jgi:hypothetical protein